MAFMGQAGLVCEVYRIYTLDVLRVKSFFAHRDLWSNRRVWQPYLSPKPPKPLTPKALKPRPLGLDRPLHGVLRQSGAARAAVCASCRLAVVQGLGFWV